MTSQELIESFGWKKGDMTHNLNGKLEIFFRGNYAIILNTARRYKDAEYIHLWVKDPALHNEMIGSDGNGVAFDFLFLGEGTLVALNALLPTEIPNA